MDSQVIAAALARDQECLGVDPEPQNSCSDQKQPVPGQLIIPARVSVLCFTCSQPRWESEWNFSIEDGVPIPKSKNILSSSKLGDLMKDNDKSGKSQKMRKKMGTVIYHRPRHVLLSA